ncbi:hypothetical protein [Acidithiobacillus sp.]|uniref:hypothetical protein n=1 Tax=Acidithiobacillus sp. TaxID=1872118 RepID=UPI003D0266E0
MNAALKFVEHSCNAPHILEKLRVLSGARYVLDDPVRFTGLRRQILGMHDPDYVDSWLADSLHDPAEMLVKFLLFRGFHASVATDLREYVASELSTLESQTLPGRHNLSSAPARLQ